MGLLNPQYVTILSISLGTLVGVDSFDWYGSLGLP